MSHPLCQARVMGQLLCDRVPVQASLSCPMSVNQYGPKPYSYQEDWGGRGWWQLPWPQSSKQGWPLTPHHGQFSLLNLGLLEQCQVRHLTLTGPWQSGYYPKIPKTGQRGAGPPSWEHVLTRWLGHRHLTQVETLRQRGPERWLIG